LKIRRVVINNRKAQLEIITSSGTVLPFPYVKLDPRPTSKNRVRRAFVDKELGREAVSYSLHSGVEGSVHLDAVLEYNEDPRHLGELLMHRLTVEARNRIDGSGLSRREIARRLRTSLPQLYRLLDPTNRTKSLNQLVALLHVLGLEVGLTIKGKRVAA
jgi:hypothetical protein